MGAFSFYGYPNWLMLLTKVISKGYGLHLSSSHPYLVVFGVIKSLFETQPYSHIMVRFISNRSLLRDGCFLIPVKRHQSHTFHEMIHV